ncbi:MAG: hypothetical protein R6V41_03460 [Desulfobacteraceae bacterium]
MYDAKELCGKIKQIYPEITECNIDVDVDWDETEKAYAVDLKTNSRKIRHYLPKEDAGLCMEGKQCVSLGLEIAQLKEAGQ